MAASRQSLRLRLLPRLQSPRTNMKSFCLHLPGGRSTARWRRWLRSTEQCACGSWRMRLPARARAWLACASTTRQLLKPSNLQHNTNSCTASLSRSLVQRLELRRLHPPSPSSLLLSRRRPSKRRSRLARVADSTGRLLLVARTQGRRHSTGERRRSSTGAVRLGAPPCGVPRRSSGAVHQRSCGCLLRGETTLMRRAAALSSPICRLTPRICEQRSSRHKSSKRSSKRKSRSRSRSRDRERRR
jgi:hypothetical protein